ncbi:MAG: hypothetical protein SOW05_05660 [Candidatus Enterosoma sp.]|nr:hypothetical protein [Candidatus Enterosoma sp.]
MRKTEYPEFIRKLRPKGTCLKKAGDIYNVYQVTSKRMPGKKYPMPQTGPLLGYIDEQGFHEKKKQVFDVQDLTSYEYGYTAYLLLHEDDFVSHFKKSHAKLLVKEAKEIFRNMILILSPYSVLAIDTSFQKKSAEELHDLYDVSVCATKSLINRIMPIDENIEAGLKCLGCIRTNKKLILSKPCEALKTHLDNIGITEEDLKNVRSKIAS